MKRLILLVLVIQAYMLHAQRIDNALVRKHITYLASDKLEGRSPGEKGGNLAAKYIANYFKRLKLKPAGSYGYFQPFTFGESLNPHDTSQSNKIQRTGKNVLAFLDNGAKNTIVIGAHYDHLGWGNHGNSLDANPNAKIHNGADDNASGVAGVLELAHHLNSNSNVEHYNYLFICFSAEESGLLGSKYFTNNPTLQLNDLNFMLNMDMIGRLNDSTKTLLVYGTGTAPELHNLVLSMNKEFRIKTDSSGIGPSDHTSFYLKNVPVLHFFTGQHSDYHKPTDDVEKINFEGEQKVLEYILTLIDSIDKLPRLHFLTTRNAEQAKSSFKVTLGIMPDYAYEGKGLRVDGVTEGKPASKAGIMQGDIIIQLGEYKVQEIQEYMKALNHFSKGETSTVSILRGQETRTFPITF